MKVHGINTQKNSYLRFAGNHANTSVVANEFKSLTDLQAFREPQDKSVSEQLKTVILSSMPETTKSLTDEEIRVANNTGELPERYCVERRSERTRFWGLFLGGMEKYVLLRGSAKRHNDTRSSSLDDGTYLTKIPEGYKIAKKKDSKSVKLVPENKKLSDNWQILK